MEKAFSERTDFQCVALEVEGKNLWVCPQQLAILSPAFESLLFGGFKESKQETVFLDQNFDEFLIFLTCLTQILPDR